MTDIWITAEEWTEEQKYLRTSANVEHVEYPASVLEFPDGHLSNRMTSLSLCD